jgi:hypothetical protein
MNHNQHSEQSIADFGFAESLQNTKPLGLHPNILLFDQLHIHCHQQREDRESECHLRLPTRHKMNRSQGNE